MKKWIIIFGLLYPLTSMAVVVYKSVDGQGNITFLTTPSPNATAINVQPAQTITLPPSTAAVNAQNVPATNTSANLNNNLPSTMPHYNFQPVIANNAAVTTISTPSDANTNSNSSILKNSVNQKLQQLEHLQLQLNAASSSFERAREIYAIALINYLTTKHALESASLPNQSFLGSQQVTANVAALKQNYEAAEAAKDQAFKMLQHAQENLQVAMNNLAQFLQQNKDL